LRHGLNSAAPPELAGAALPVFVGEASALPFGGGFIRPWGAFDARIHRKNRDVCATRVGRRVLWVATSFYSWWN